MYLIFINRQLHSAKCIHVGYYYYYYYYYYHYSIFCCNRLQTIYNYSITLIYDDLFLYKFLAWNIIICVVL
ncbi:MAG: hypothetical protein K7J15_03700, partial [Candidatus Regiella insecticola]|nr:hypothetical protein [Candidatus Regiella insecticola]